MARRFKRIWHDVDSSNFGTRRGTLRLLVIGPRAPLRHQKVNVLEGKGKAEGNLKVHLDGLHCRVGGSCRRVGTRSSRVNGLKDVQDTNAAMTPAGP